MEGQQVMSCRWVVRVEDTRFAGDKSRAVDGGKGVVEVGRGGGAGGGPWAWGPKGRGVGAATRWFDVNQRWL